LLQRLLTWRSGVAWVLASGTLGLLHCTGSSAAETVGVSREAIVGGAVVDAPSSPALYLSGPGGTCSAVLIAPTLVATARHCVSYLNGTGTFDCTPSGELQDGSTDGELGADYAAGMVTFFSSESVAENHLSNGSPPDAVGTQILSTHTPSVCSDDLAFVVLEKPIAGLVPAPVWLGSIADGDPVDVWGYGLTQTAEATYALRVSEGASIVGIGPTEPTTLTEPAPVRSVRVGPGTTTCNGDSGGPIMSNDGAVIAIVSLGLQSSNGVDCMSGNNAVTTGPLLADYKELLDLAFAAAGASPPGVDAGFDAGKDGAMDTGTTRATESAVSPESTAVGATGGSCALRPARADSSMGLRGAALAIAGAAGAIGRKRRR
jgi:hypothetical protein